MERRNFLKHSISATYLALIYPKLLFSSPERGSKLNFGIISDTHADMLPDTLDRLESFIAMAIRRDVQFIIQLGDFCHPREQERDFLKIWNQFPGPRYHVLGNHDMDFATKEETMEYWQMPSKYYSFDQGNFHFIILDANYLNQEGKYTDYQRANFYVDDKYRAFIPPEQIEWLKDDLQKTNKNVMIFSHQSLINPCWGIKNRIEIQDILEKVNKNDSETKVVACFNGHDHIDFHRFINGIHYLEINSASYQWLGEAFSNKTRYAKEYYEHYQHLDKVAPYKDPVYCFINATDDGKLIIDGVKSQWLAPSPQELGVPEQVYGCRNSAQISNRILNY